MNIEERINRIMETADDEVVDMDEKSKLDESTVVETDEVADEVPEADIDDDESDDIEEVAELPKETP